MELQQDCRTTKDRQDCTKTLGNPQTASKCRPFAPEPASHRNRSGITERHPPKTLQCRRYLLQSRNSTIHTANPTIPTDRPKSITFSLGRPHQACPTLHPAAAPTSPTQHNPQSSRNPHAISESRCNPRTVGPETIEPETPRHLFHDPRRNTFSPHAITEIPTRRKDPSIAAPLHTVDRDLHMPTPNPISAIPMQSTIKLQSCCNPKITMHSENGWAGDYRTREASRAQPFSHCARIRRLRRNPADRNPHTQGLRPISNPGEHKSFSVAAKRRKLHLPPSPPFTKHDNITTQPAQSQCNPKSRCIPSALQADTQTWQPRSIPQKRAHPNPPSTTPNQRRNHCNPCAI